MKELTIEEKAKRYDELIVTAQELEHDGCFDKITLFDLFPEIEESEDERIKKAIKYGLDYVFTNNTTVYETTKEQCLAWLEKQGEQKSIDALTQQEAMDIAVAKCFEQGEQKLVLDKESSFVDNDVRLSLELYRDGNGFGIWLSDDFGGSGIEATGNTPEEAANSIAAYIADYFYKRDDIINMVTEKPADKVEPKFKVGDWVMVDRPVLITKVEDMPYNNHQYWTSDGTWFGDGTEAKLWTIQDAKDGDVLSWDDNKCIAIFKNIYDEESFNSYGFVGGCTGTFESRMSYHDIEGAHPATKEQRDTLIKAMADAGYAFDFEKKELKKIEQKTAWSKEDEDILNTIINHFKVDIGCTDEDDMVRWLKSLKDRYTWKPSEGQMDALNDVISSRDIKYDVLSELWKDLKKLREE